MATVKTIADNATKHTVNGTKMVFDVHDIVISNMHPSDVVRVKINDDLSIEVNADGDVTEVVCRYLR